MKRWQTISVVVGGAGCLATFGGVGQLFAADSAAAQPADDRYIEIPLNDRPATTGRTKAPVPPPPRDSNPQIDALVGQLGDADFRKREAAVAKLKDMGPTVLPALKRAVDQATDPEVVSRAEGVIRFFERPHVPGGLPTVKDFTGVGGVGGRNLRMKVENGARKIEVIEQNGRIVRIESGPNGINMAVTGEEDGKPVTRNFQARTPDELAKQNPEAFELYQRWLGQRDGQFQVRRMWPGGFRPGMPRPNVPLRPIQPKPGVGDPMLEMRELFRRDLDPAGADAAARHHAEIMGMLEQLRRMRTSVDPFDGIGQRMWQEREAARLRAKALDERMRQLNGVDGPDW